MIKVTIETLVLNYFFRDHQAFFIKNHFFIDYALRRSIHPVSRSNLVDMPHALSQSKSNAVKVMLELNMTHDTIAAEVKCSERQVRRILHNLLHYGSVKRPKADQQGRKPNLTAEMEQVSFFHVNPNILILGTSRIPKSSMYWIC